MILSPQAHPFHPVMGEDVNGIIYNDGIPIATTEGYFTKNFNFSEETMDEAFPPTAEDAAELEAVEIYVELMARLDLLERQEEAERLVHEALQRRLHARRGLVGRDHTTGPIVLSNSDKFLEYRMHAKEHSRREKPRCQSKSTMKQAMKMPIHQPRKHS